MSFALVVSGESRSATENLKQLGSLLGSMSDKGERHGGEYLSLRWRCYCTASLLPPLTNILLCWCFPLCSLRPFVFLFIFWYTVHPSIWHCCFSIFVCKDIDKIDCFPRRTIVIDFGGKIYKLHADRNKLLINCFLSLMSVNTEPDLSSA